MTEIAEDCTGVDSASDDLDSPLTSYQNLAPEHAKELFGSSVPASVAAEQRVHTAHTRGELPAWAQWIAEFDSALPALVYPMVHPDGSETGQVKPAPGTVTSSEGRPLKYVSPGHDDGPPKLPVLRTVKSPEVVLIVEGVKQALAALSWAPETWSIYRIAGIWSWRVAGDGEDVPGTPTPHLTAVQGQNVVIVPDADAKSNVRVFDGAVALGEACRGYGAASVKFARLPGAGKDGLDDLLVRLADDDARRELLKSWVTTAKSRPADLNQRQRERLRAKVAAKDAQKAAKAAVSGDAFDGRVGIDLDGDPRQVSLHLLSTLVENRGGGSIFQLNRKLVRLRRGDDGALRADELDPSGLHRELLDVTCPFRMMKTGVQPMQLLGPTLGLVADHWNELPRLTGVTRSPVVRSDGTINTTDGYDAETGLYLDLSSDIRGIEVPEHPTDADVAAARTMIRDDLFAMDGAGGYDGWVFRDVADQTNAVAGMLTPLIRSQVTCVPLLLFDGIQPGVGKGGLLEMTHQVPFGTPASVQPAPRSDEEMDKRIVAQLSESSTSVCLDEVQDEDDTCRLKSASLRAALTSAIYRGRELAKTKMLNLPNMASWYALGNNVQIPADMARRVVPVRLDSDRPNLENRDSFRHDLVTWVPEHRTELLQACLVLVRAWYDRDQPIAPKSFGFASFGEWQRIVGGILHLAGFEGFLANVMEVREAADSEGVDNRECWAWAESLVPVGTRWGAGEVYAQGKADPDAPPPYGTSWKELDARKLSRYFGQHPRWYGDLRIRADGRMHGGAKAFVFERLPSGVSAVPTSSSASPPAPGPRQSGPRPAAGTAPGEVIELTDRSGVKQRVARAMPTMNGKTIAELGGDAS